MSQLVCKKVQDGKTGEYKELMYTQQNVVGSGSFGIVFQTKISPSGEDAAIKRVLQDKRFKVCPALFFLQFLTFLYTQMYPRLPMQTDIRAPMTSFSEQVA